MNRRRGWPGRRSQDSDEGGAVTVWLLVLVLMLFSLGGLSVDLWHVVSERRALVAIADAAAFAGASGLDTDAYREQQLVRLDPGVATRLADRSIIAQGDDRGVRSWQVAVSPGGELVTVTLHGEIDTFLLQLLDPRFDTLDVAVTASSEPRIG